MKKIKEYILARKKTLIALLAIIALGTFLRTYHFKDFMVFNPDQARDAMLVDDILSGRESAVLIGPEVGNERFGLGPWFYHLEILSAKIFGTDPWKLAIPDLLFSILTIPLFYLFVKKYFKTDLSLVLTFLLSISWFMVRYSRFAFNPNSIPFFVLFFLLGMIYILESDKKKGLWGAALAGIGIGVGLQLHILLLFIMPTVAGIFFLYIFFKKRPFLPQIGKIAVIALFILLTNIGQIMYENEHNWSNSKKFLKTFTSSAESAGQEGSLGRDILCHAQANLHLVSSLGNSEQCDFYKISGKDRPDLLLFVFGIVYTAGGYMLLFYYWRREKDEARRNFLALAGTYGLVSLVAMFPIITQASLRYYIIIFFLSFVFLGLWLKFLGEKLPKDKRLAGVALMAGIFVFFQIIQLEKVYADFANQTASNEDYAIWGEINPMMDYIRENSRPGERVIIAGKNEYFSRFYKPLLYLGKNQGVDINRGDKTKKIKSGDHVFYLQDDLPENPDTKTFINRRVKNYQKFGRITVINLEYLNQ